MHTEILVAQAPGSEQGPYFIHPTHPWTGTYADAPFRLACIGEFENRAILAEPNDTADFPSSAVIVAQLVLAREKKQSFIVALMDALHEVRGQYALVAVWNSVLVATCTPTSSLVMGGRDGTMYIASDAKLIEVQGGLADTCWSVPFGQVFVKEAGQGGPWVTPRRPIHLRLWRGLRSEGQRHVMNQIEAMFGQVTLAHAGSSVVLSVQDRYFGNGRTIGEAADDMLACIDRAQYKKRVLPENRT